MSVRPMCPKDHDHKHGESSTCYWYGCRCEACGEYVVERQFYYRNMRKAGRYTAPARVNAVGTHRRLQALETLGWSAEQIGDRLGVSGARIRQLRQAALISAENAEKVRGVYDELWATPAPVTPASSRTRNRARRLGWVPPLAWDDDTIDDPTAVPVVAPPPEEAWLSRCDDLTVEAAVRGDKPDLSPLERREAVRRLWRRHWSDSRIAAWIDCSDKQVLRIRGELGLVAWEKGEQEWAA